MSIYVPAILVSWLFCAAEPAPRAAEAVAAPEGVADAVPHQYLVPAGVSQSPGPMVPKRLTAWCSYVRDSHYAPGALRNPSNSWWKHAYLAYRGNYYLQGYDYRTGRDYPWHGSTSNRACLPRLSPSPGGATELLSPTIPNSQSSWKTSAPAAPLP